MEILLKKAQFFIQVVFEQVSEQFSKRLLKFSMICFVFHCELAFCQFHTVQHSSNKIQAIITMISQVPAGERLLQKALHFWNLEKKINLLHFIKWSESSRTDTVLTRRFNPRNGKEDQIREVTIYINKEQPFSDAALDLAHELVHATSRPSFDPYDPTLTASKYISAAIDGEGGEVQAVMNECEVGLQLAAMNGFNLDRCQQYLEFSALPLQFALNQSQIQKDFYKVGKWYPIMMKELDDSQLLPFLSNDSPQFISSTGQAPYPISLLQEFQGITDMACQNSLKRMGSINSIEVSSSNEGREQLQLFIQMRCNKIIQLTHKPYLQKFQFLRLLLEGLAGLSS